ncbi:MAG: nucleotidyltransferase domain-containing protein [Candidatus Magasanikbacteria bacterium]|jgi:hypothetical protein
MFSADDVSTIHRELQRIFYNGKVYLGGSYLYNEANQDSDVDFYFVGSIFACFFHKRQKARVADLKTRYPYFSIMLLPKLSVRFGIFYFYGRDLDGRLRYATPNKRLVIGNCIKFAYFNYLRSLLGSAKSGRCLRKSYLQLAAARCIASDPDYREPIFSRQYLRAHGYWYEGEFCDFVDQLTLSLNKYLGFSWLNYIIYNVRFGLLGNFEFIGRNPDRWIVGCLQEGLKDNRNFDKLLERIRRVIFPVIIL